ncbi:LysR family transcriptional regulator [Massilia sp. YIM B02763]|uniref:LysR family transcriptional regulator n=1 Tax=Massilia sp. YIM B02763 TaxID=3050130 RepID=UPI0025B67D54|nr:LysR family transcriptional regulator [Massilia sp. YIM B02763]MDN4054712.1 LysR family transcriptional regulator [Massilia sp. YIM B02763]
MRKDLDYGLLHAMNAFVHVLDGGSFTAAAEHMGVTKAQVSRLVTLLENRLQTKLLYRTTRRLAPTGVGERYAAQCKAILDMVARAEGEASGAGQSAGRLRVMSMTAFGNRYVAPLVAAYCTDNPRVTIEYSSSQNPPDLLAEGIDVSVYLAQYLPDSALVALKLGQMVSVLCAAPDYLARRGVPQHPHDLSRHTCLRLVNSSVTSYWELDDGAEHVKLDPEGPLVGNAAEVVLDSALRGLGIAMLPLYSVVDDLRRGTLVQVLPAWRSPEIGIFALLPSGRFVDAKTRAWIDLLKQELPRAVARDMAFFD